MNMINQNFEQSVDIATWDIDPEFGTYPEGKLDKTLILSPSSLPFNFLKKSSKYLFKRSSHRYLEQFWVEILAYQLGLQMGISVPPTFVAYNSKLKQCGALIEWFINIDEIFTPGGDYCIRYINNYGRKKGEQHNFESVSKIFEDLSIKYPECNIDWKIYWAKTFVFDALIGNIDRHQDNWGILTNTKKETIRISPVFDNGSSMGREIFAENFKQFEEHIAIEKYISKGKHHMKWLLADTVRQGHFELLSKMAQKYPETIDAMKNCINKVNQDTFQTILEELVKFDIPIKLSLERAEFMLKLLTFRHNRLKNVFGY